MSNNYRELTGREKQRIKKLITSRCASYDKEYGCLPLDCDCPMFGICYTNSGLCSYFRKYVLPTEPELQAVFEAQPLSVCKALCRKDFPGAFLCRQWVDTCCLVLTVQMVTGKRNYNYYTKIS